MKKKDNEVKLSFDDSEQIINSLTVRIRLALTGPENIGKTTLLKIIYKTLHIKGYVPIYIEGYNGEFGVTDYPNSEIESRSFRLELTRVSK